MCTDGLQTGADVDGACQRGTVVEGVVSDGGDTVSEDHRGDLLTITEGVVLDPLNGGGKGQCAGDECGLAEGVGTDGYDGGLVAEGHGDIAVLVEIPGGVLVEASHRTLILRVCVAVSESVSGTDEGHRSELGTVLECRVDVVCYRVDGERDHQRGKGCAVLERSLS